MYCLMLERTGDNTRIPVMKTCTTHAREHFYELKSNAATDCTDKVVYRCTFCVAKNDGQAIMLHCFIQQPQCSDKTGI